MRDISRPKQVLSGHVSSINFGKYVIWNDTR